LVAFPIEPRIFAIPNNGETRKALPFPKRKQFHRTTVKFWACLIIKELKEISKVNCSIKSRNKAMYFQWIKPFETPSNFISSFNVDPVFIL
jgi:hypothetical protein